MSVPPKLKKYWLSLMSVFVFFLFWEAASRANLIDPLFISSPSKIFASGYTLLKTGEIFPHLAASLIALVLGFFMAAIIGTILGLLIGSNKILYSIFFPYIFALNSLPMVAVVPLIIIWFGIGLYAKVAVVFFMSLSPILISTIDGFRNVDKKLLKMAKSFGADYFFTLRTVILLNAMPFIFSGLRMAVGKGIIGLVVGEAFGYGKGLGFLVAFYGNTFQVARLIFIILILMAISLIATNLVAAAEKKVINWKG